MLLDMKIVYGSQDISITSYNELMCYLVRVVDDVSGLCARHLDAHEQATWP